MNAGLREMTKNWFRQGETEMADDEIPPPPPAIAMLPAPKRDDRGRAAAKGHR